MKKMNLKKTKMKEGQKQSVDFQTPEWVCEIMVDLIPGNPETILEPTPGAGNLVTAIGKRLSSVIYTPARFEEFNKERVRRVLLLSYLSTLNASNLSGCDDSGG